MTVMESPDLAQRKLGTILVVEDDVSLRKLTQVQLDKLGYRTLPPTLVKHWLSCGGSQRGKT